MIGLLIGRFQPLHKGHIKAIKRILEEVDGLIIVIGSSQHTGSLENPFSAVEREEMLKRALKQEGIIKVEVHKIPDINNDNLYPGHVIGLVPYFDVVYTGNNLVYRLFKIAGKKVRKIRFFRKKVYSGSEIRRRMVKGRRWQHLVPEPALKFLLEIDGENRVKRLAKNL